MQLLMEFPLVTAMRCVGLVDVAVARFESPVNAGFVDNAGPAVVCQNSEEQRIIRSEIVIEGYELAEVFPQQDVSLSFGKLHATAVRFSRLDLVSRRLKNCMQILQRR